MSQHSGDRNADWPVGTSPFSTPARSSYGQVLSPILLSTQGLSQPCSPSWVQGAISMSPQPIPPQAHGSGSQSQTIPPRSFSAYDSLSRESTYRSLPDRSPTVIAFPARTPEIYSHGSRVASPYSIPYFVREQTAVSPSGGSGYHEAGLRSPSYHDTNAGPALSSNLMGTYYSYPSLPQWPRISPVGEPYGRSQEVGHSSAPYHSSGPSQSIQSGYPPYHNTPRSNVT